MLGRIILKKFCPQLCEPFLICALYLLTVSELQHSPDDVPLSQGGGERERMREDLLSTKGLNSHL